MTERRSWRLALTSSGVDIVPAEGREAMPGEVVEPVVAQWFDEGYAIERGPDSASRGTRFMSLDAIRITERRRSK